MADISGVSATGQEILDHQQKVLDYLYDMPLANDSLFLAKVTTNDSNGQEVAQFRIKKISYTPQKIKYDGFDNTRRMSFMTGVERNDTVTIEWIEDAFDTIQKWHIGMLNQIVNLKTGLWNVGGAKNAQIPKVVVTKFAYVEGNSEVESPFDSVAYPAPTSELEIINLKPEGVPEITYDSEAGGSVKTVSITYRIDHIELKDYASAKTMWNSKDFMGFGGELTLL